MSSLYYLTHPDVTVDPAIPVDQWHLSEIGHGRALAMLDQPWVRSLRRIVSSTETKALETAAVLAAHTGLAVEPRPGTGENDRSATGFVPPDEFETLANAFFADPQTSVRGWERAIDAQHRIAGALADLLDPSEGDVAVVGHGAVGTLWYCHLSGLPIDRRYDQPSQGHYFCIDLPPISVRHAWRPIDQLPEPGH